MLREAMILAVSLQRFSFKEIDAIKHAGLGAYNRFGRMASCAVLFGGIPLRSTSKLLIMRICMSVVVSFRVCISA